MKKWLIPIDSALPASLVGSKAAALGHLVEAGFPVPDSLCITTDAFYAAASAEGELRLPAGLMEDLTRHLPIHTPLAVRSSALQEDRPDASLAGRYATHLNVTGKDALANAILDIWRSSRTLPDPDAGGMAVLIQPLIDAECAGVCFTVDPVRLEPRNLLVAAGWGLGAGVVGGSVPTDTIRLRRQDLRTGHVSITNKHTAMRPAATGGVSPVPVDSGRCSIPCLPDDWLQRVGQYGLCIEQLFGTPQDIEWAIADERVWILQSRPITALPDEVRGSVRFPIHWENAEEPRHYWWLQQARDSTGAPLLPAELDFSRLSIQGGQDAVYYGGIDQTRWRKQANGRVYWTVASPPHSAGHSRVYRAALLERYDRLRQQDVTQWEYFGPEIVSATRRLAAFDAPEADGSALADHLENAVATSIRHWMEHTIGPGRPIRDKELLDVYARMTGLPPEEAASEIPFLISGAETIQTRLVECLYDLACLAREFPDEARTITLLNNGKVSSSTSSKHEKYAHTLEHLVSEYGDRLAYLGVPGYPVEIPLTWRESPEHVWEMINAYLPLAEQGGPGPREIRLQTKNAADQRIESLCDKALEVGTDPELIDDFRRKLAYARRNAFSLDEHNHYIDQLSEGQFVQALLYAGRWLAAHGLLPGPFDVYWLEVDEVLAALRGTPPDLEAILHTRRALFEEWKALLPPPCLGLPDPRLEPRPADPVSTIPSESLRLPANTLAGEPASRGKASGRARISDGNTLPADITASDILIIPFASPLLIPLLPAVAGVVLDYGGPGDHFAITAREFGLPAICGTIHATRLIAEGSQVTMDADAGIVAWI